MTRNEILAFIESVYQLWFTAFPDCQFVQEEIIIDDQRAAVIARIERRILDFTGVLLQVGVLKARPA